MNNLIVQYLMTLIGQPYRWGGDDAINGFDCSGLAMEILTAFGFKIQDMNSHNLFVWCKVQGFKNQRMPGALAFFGKREAITHMGVVLNEHLMVEAGGGAQDTVSLDVAAKRNAFVRIRPILHRRDFVDLYYPVYPVKINA